MSVTTDQNEVRQAVLDWLASPAARKCAVSRLLSSGFNEAETLAPDVVADAYFSVMKRFNSAAEFAPDNPEAYATSVVQNTVHKLSRGEKDGFDDVDPKWTAEEWVPPSDVDDSADEIRVLLEQSPAEPWLTSAALACVCFIGHPDTIPDDAPSPKAGAKPEQARVWPALWFAGQRDLFPDGRADPCKRTRARRIEKVLNQLEDAYARFIADRGRADG